METFVLSELLKHIGYSDAQPQFYHYRTTDKKEIDFILEKQDQIIAIEVKSSQRVKAGEFRHIVDLQNRSKKRVLGVVLYAGEHVLSFGGEGQQWYAVPLSVFF